MSERAEDLASKYDEAVERLITTIAGLPEEVWTMICLDLGWTVAATARHIAEFMESDIEWLEEAARGEETAVQPIDLLHRRNAERALAQSHADKAETITLIRSAHQRARAKIASLTGDQLARRFPMDVFFPGDVSSDPWVATTIERTGESASLEDMIEHIHIGHLDAHLSSIRAAIDEASKTPSLAGESEGVAE